MSAPLRIGFLTGHNPFDRSSFSGTVHYMMRALQARPDVALHVLGNHRQMPRRSVGRVLNRLRRAPGFTFDPRTVEAVDMVLAPVASRLVAQHAGQLSRPVISVTDATPAFLREFYGRQLPPEIDETEARALAASARVVYSSRYMADRALREFPELDPARVHALPFGINLDHLPASVPDKPDLSELRLLFIGQDWERKGGALALGALKALLHAGCRARLSVIGSSSPEAEAHPQVDVLGYIDKNDPGQSRKLTQALERAHLFVLPTRADCTPMVVAEANSHGCPVLITETGGIGTLMAEGINGRMLPMAAGAEDWAAAARALTQDREAYTALSRSSFRHAHEKLTWDAWAAGIVGIMRELSVMPEADR